jgi:hypothetical protein
MQPIIDIEKIVDEFKGQSGPYDRYTSFDYCFNYFRKTKSKELTNDIEKSCLVLGFYLASWGMLRGSSFLLQRSVKHFEPVIKYLATLDSEVWEIDIDKYSDENIKTVLQIYTDIKLHIVMEDKAHKTLVTKIMLGVFGFIPAYDQNFLRAFSQIFIDKCAFTNVSKKSLICLKDFYDVNNIVIDKISAQTFTKDFLTGQKTNINYPKAKIIDMYGFTIGQK